MEGLSSGTVIVQHPVFPDIPMVQGELFFECTLFLYSVLVLFLQYLNLYKTLWWLPNSYTHHALKFHMIDLYVLSCVGLILGRRVIWCFLKRLTFISTSCSKKWTFGLLFLEWSLKLPAVGAILTSFSFSFVHVFTCLAYVLLFYHDLTALFNQSGRPLASRLWNYLCENPAAESKIPIHVCSVEPNRIREEANILVIDVYNRFKQSLFAAFTTVYYAVFIPCSFAPVRQASQNSRSKMLYVFSLTSVVFFTAFTLYVAYLFPIQLCDQMHRCAVHLGLWIRIKNFRVSQMLHTVWSDTLLWPDGCVIKHNKRIYRGEGPCVAAQPDSDDQRRFHVSGDFQPFCSLIAASLIVAQFLMLVHSIEWQHIVSLVLLMFANYVLLFKIFKDKIILGRIHCGSNRLLMQKTK
ncbi:Transmembrane protein 39A [Trichuris trichiura]|uniref:Transmembrane protein 39A n=1 Tax=Trichuris trichiura TaxID=36087 RepID=A0A077ZD85_TRITR|nr:Transmembrane protein 39A [Trichuris trichiura]